MLPHELASGVAADPGERGDSRPVLPAKVQAFHHIFHKNSSLSAYFAVLCVEVHHKLDDLQVQDVCDYPRSGLDLQGAFNQ